MKTVWLVEWAEPGADRYTHRKVCANSQIATDFRDKLNAAAILVGVSAASWYPSIQEVEVLE